MDRKQKAKEYFSEGMNCCQAVLSVFCEQYDLDKELALQIASGFGGGLQNGEVCGVVTGAVMAIGLRYGNKSIEDINSKEKAAQITKAFQKEFEERYSSVLCKGLLGYDVSIEEEKIYIKEQGIAAERCPSFVTGAVEILEKLL